MSETITREALLALVDQWLAAGTRVVGPVAQRAGRTAFAPLSGSAQLRLDGFVHAANSAKEQLLPKSEKLYGYQREGNQVRLTEPPPEAGRTVLIGGRPCDAAAFPIVDKVMNWDYRDSQYNRRRAGLTVVTLACREWDDQCFCTSVDLGPADERGSDVVLMDLGDDVFEVRVVTDRGRELLDGRTRTADRVAEPVSGPPVRIDLDRIQEALRAGFDSPVWQAQAMRCIGCGSCTFTCPTCHCFDMVDESHGTSGCRVRNWDACQFSLFTAHASGHNPRADQAARQRQRSLHKFVIYPQKFDDYLCTGCGNCFRNCPVNLGVLNVLQAVNAATAATAGVEG